jgi:lipopolysaccharide transport system ATP-binding protein
MKNIVTISNANLSIKSNKQSGRVKYLLRDINLQVQPGDSIGIMGNNGAGKSTLLRLVGGVYKPSSGKIEVNTKIASLIELTGGIKPSLTGRENIFLMAGLHGMRNNEIKLVLDLIIEFSELKDSIDLPVRIYSSGMVSRLAFSIIVFLEADLYLLDEVLAVGDKNFKTKCFKVIEEWKHTGKTLVIVSHSFEEIKQFCDSVIWLRNGSILEIIKSDSFSKDLYHELCRN